MDDAIDFVDGIKTIAGQGDPTTKEGLAVHIYAANVSMRNRAFCSSDGDMLLMPQVGRLDIQTEFGRLVLLLSSNRVELANSQLSMMVRPGELAVIQAGIRFKVKLPDGPVRGCKLPSSEPWKHRS
jgi:homogentisate 1,2-dioxygenase